MKRRIITTKDGSTTIRLEDWNEHYHSIHGAIQEAQHVYIQAGLDCFKGKYQPTSITVLEAGFGSGLNALLTHNWARKHKIKVNYIGLEAFPVSELEWKQMNYASGNVDQDVFMKLHKSSWNVSVEISDEFNLNKKKLLFSELKMKSCVDIVFYDAFGPRVQPDLWEESVFQNFYDVLKPGGVFVTYSVKGTARRALEAIGFKVDVIEGPPGKRHMMRAYKAL